MVGTDPDGEDSVMVIALPAADPTAKPSRTPTPTETPQTTATPETTPPSSPDASPTVVATPSPTASQEPSDEPSATPEVTVEPSNPTSLAIVSGVRIVGESAAYSTDGDWFAFTARPSDDSAGPDIYVWRVGDAASRPADRRPRERLRVVVGRPAHRQPSRGHRARNPPRSRRNPS